MVALKIERLMDKIDAIDIAIHDYEHKRMQMIKRHATPAELDVFSRSVHELHRNRGMALRELKDAGGSERAVFERRAALGTVG